MSGAMGNETRRWVVRRTSPVVLDIIQGKTTVAEASRRFDLLFSEIESRAEDGKSGVENAHREEAYGEAVLELRARKNCSPCRARMMPAGHDPAGRARSGVTSSMAGLCAGSTTGGFVRCGFGSSRGGGHGPLSLLVKGGWTPGLEEAPNVVRKAPHRADASYPGLL